MSKLVPLLAIAGTVCFFIWVVFKHHQKRSQQEKRQRMLKDPSFIYDWMHNENFQPDHFSFHEGSAIGIQEGDSRILLVQASIPKFYALQELQSVEPHETVSTARPLGAAPGIVETREFRHYSLTISFGDENQESLRIFFEDKDQANAWDNRLIELIATQHQP